MNIAAAAAVTEVPMDFSLAPITEAGKRFVEMAEEHAADFVTRADKHDREGSFPFENFEAMKQSGFLMAPVPEEFGGLGLSSVHDLGVGISRLGRGDGSTAIAVNMHLAFALIASRTLRSAREAGDEPLTALASGVLKPLGNGVIGMCNMTEVGTDLRHPLTEATRVDGGWSISGRKTFGTLSPVANIFAVSVRAPHPDGTYISGIALVPRGAPGQEIKDNWDALGMRASGSGDVLYEKCIVPESLFLPGGRWGEDTEQTLLIATAASYGQTAAFLGIAEAARDIAVEIARTRRRAPSGRLIAERPTVQHFVAEMDVGLAVCRAMLERSGKLLDAYLCDRPIAEVSMDQLHQLNKDYQCTKLETNRKTVEIVDLALTVSGGAGYMSASPLSRLYRDVRAGPFMQRLSPNEAYEYIGKVALGLDPTIEN
jgi:alkylation response protein AidB-like acyl-CoA dehydrogenase